MTATINANTTTGVVVTSDTSGALALQTAGTTALTISSAQAISLTNALPIASGGTGSSTLAGANIATTNSSTQSITSINTFGFKNRIINGGMTIDQRNAGASVTPSNNDYITDRWRINYSGNFTCQQNAGSVTPPVGFTNYLGATSTGTNSPTGNTTYSFLQFIEGYNIADLAWGTANAKTVTLSFWVRSSATGTFGGSLQNSASTRSYPFSYTISVASTWEQKTITITGDTSGTWLTTNGAGISVVFCMGGGANYQGTANTWAGTDYRTVSGQTNALASSTNYFYITGVQLEVGSQATSFDFRDYGRELILCQRYYYKIQAISGASSVNILTVNLYTYQSGYSPIILPVAMRANPTGSYSAVSDFYVGSNGSYTVLSSITANNGSASPNLVEFYWFTASSFTSGQSGFIRINNTTGWLAYSAEL